MKSALAVAFAALALIVAGVPDSQRHTRRPHLASRALAARKAGAPAYDAVWGAATHNSYWIERDRFGERGASGTQERILDQLLHEHVRAIELDVHSFDGRPGVFSVYHTDKVSNSLCSPLDECLKQLELFQYLVPEHDVVNVVLELKEMWGHVFDRSHTIADLDALLRRHLGDALFTPRELLSRCPPGATLRECARSAGWPTIDRLRGRFIVNVLGNWNYNANDWVAYATASGGVAARAAFPMRSLLDEDGRRSSGLIGDGVHDPFDATALRAADEASIFWQVEAIDHPDVDRFVAEHGLVRARSAHTYAEQLERIRRGFQLVMTDHPWHIVDESPAGPAPIHAGRRLHDGAAPLVEPGHRLYAVADGDFMSATATSAAAASEWETAPSTTRPGSGTRWGLSLARQRFIWDRFAGRARPRGMGCLRAASNDGSEYFMVCRQTVSGEFARVTVRWRRRGERAERVRTFDSDAHSAGAVGDLIRLRTARLHGRSCAGAASASQLAGGAPLWTALGAECFAAPLDEQGLAATRDVLFVGTRHDGAFVGAAALPHRSGALVDQSQ